MSSREYRYDEECTVAHLKGRLADAVTSLPAWSLDRHHIVLIVAFSAILFGILQGLPAALDATVNVLL